MAAVACIMAMQDMTAIVTEAPAAALSPTAIYWSSASAAPGILAAVAATQRKGFKRRHISANWAEYNDLGFTNEKEWVGMFRLTRAVFDEVVDSIKGHAIFAAPRNIGERKLSVDKQLAIFLMRVGSAKPIHEIRKLMGVSETTVTTCTRRVAGCRVSPGLPAADQRVCAQGQGGRHVRGHRLPRRARNHDCTLISVNVPTDARRKGTFGSYLNRKG